MTPRKNIYNRFFNIEDYNNVLQENKIKSILKNNNIVFVPQKRFDDCRYKNPLPFDIAIPIENGWILIEYNGIQHYIPQQFGGISKETAIKNYNSQVERDNIKRNYCLDNNISFIEISYLDYNNIENILRENSII